ncbi:MAG: hypothetical protein M5R36_10660 [Deltaproteobacteria bacterium]|nr:hypothetical protein [Deltaproteobacteria bacterium]
MADQADDTVIVVSESGGRPAFPQRNVRLHEEFEKRLADECPAAKVFWTASTGRVAGRRLRFEMPLIVVSAEDRAFQSWLRPALVDRSPAAFQLVSCAVALTHAKDGSPAPEFGEDDVCLSPSAEAAFALDAGARSSADEFLKIYSMEGVHETHPDDTGLLIAKGPGVVPGAHGSVALRDIAPTVLSVMGISKPETMSGRIIW